MSRKVAKAKVATLDSYGDGCREGYFLAQGWLNNPRRGDPCVGGTLQYLILDLAAKFKLASSEKAATRIRGEIVGFCYAVECPEDSARCLAAVAKSG
jgi:hypothetical protein